MKKVLIAKPNYKKFSPTGYQMLLDKGYDVVCTDLDRDYFLEELLPMVGDIDGCIANCEPWGEEAMSAAPKVKILARYGTGMNSVDTEAAKRYEDAIAANPILTPQLKFVDWNCRPRDS